MSAFSHKLGQVTYPRMERQDLTQSQLGSFKFTPTDEVRHVFSRPSPQLAQQFINPPSRNTHPRKAPRISITLPNNSHSPQESPNPTSSPTRFDSAFFDTYIKPDLAKSRLVLGPNALRAAVDGSPTSPQRHSIAMDTNTTGHAGAPEFVPFNMTSHTTDQIYSALPQDSALQFTALSPTAAQDDASLLHTSLVRALASEQQAHQVTKDALEVEKCARLRAEAEAQKYLEHNRSLVGSVNMLKSVIQHNVKKEQQATQKAEYERFYADVKAANQPRTILHDAVEKMREQVAARAALAKTVDNHNLFDFDLVERHGSPALRRHFSGRLIEPPRVDSFTENQSDQLINVTPEKIAPKQRPNNMEVTSNLVPSQPVAESTRENEVVVLRNKSTNKIEKKDQAAEKVMVMPFDAHVQWTNDPVFENEQDRLNRLGYGKSMFARHPVRYVPRKCDKNLYRTIMVDFIPIGTEYKAILDQIRGGTVESIQLIGPIGQSTSFMTARIVFTYELGARGVYMRGQNPGIEINNKGVRIWQVLEPTYPRDPELEKEIFEDGYSRLLLIQDAVQPSLKKLPQKLARQVQAGSVIEIGQAYDGLPMIEFTSIAECSKALKQLLSDPDFGGSQFDFEQDPCNDPY